MKKTYIFEGKAFCDDDAIGLILEKLKGRSVIEQLHASGIRIIKVDNKVKEMGYVNSLNTPKAKKLLCPIPGFRRRDFAQTRDNFIVGLNVRKHRKNYRHNYLTRACETVAHEIAHTYQMDAKNCHRRGYIEIGNLSTTCTSNADERFCDKFSEPWLMQDTNFSEVKLLLEGMRRHDDLLRIFPSFAMPLTV